MDSQRDVIGPERFSNRQTSRQTDKNKQMKEGLTGKHREKCTENMREKKCDCLSPLKILRDHYFMSFYGF
jgi:hypothetical protein